MSAKMATPGLLKIRVFWKKGYDVIISIHGFTNKFLSLDSNYIIDVVMSPKFGNCSISMRKVIINSILQGFDQKNRFFDGWSRFKFNNLGMALGTNLKFYASVAKVLKLKVPPPYSILNRVKILDKFRNTKEIPSISLPTFCVKKDLIFNMNSF